MIMEDKTRALRLAHFQRKVVAELIPRLADQLLLNVRNQRTIEFAIDDIKAIEQEVRKAMHHPANGTVRNSFRHIIEATTKAIENSQGIGTIRSADRVFQFKITLIEWKPPIWRRIHVKNCTLDKLHEHIQTAMGWTNSHLHQFEINSRRYGDPELLDDGFEDFECIDSTVTKISEIVPQNGKPFAFLYQYDFGDNWEHEVVFEGCLQADPETRYPVCVEGERACPPEDVGGVWGFKEFLEAINNPKQERHEELMEWGGDFDDERFDPKEATKEMRRGLPAWR